MRMIFFCIPAIILSLFLVQMAWSAPEFPVKNMVTMVDLGSTSCIPCKMMEPVLKNLEKEYAGGAAILFVNVKKDMAIARKYDIRAIPTQIFFDKEGKEVWRHAGFLEQKVIEEKLNGLLSK